MEDLTLVQQVCLVSVSPYQPGSVHRRQGRGFPTRCVHGTEVLAVQLFLNKGDQGSSSNRSDFTNTLPLSPAAATLQAGAASHVFMKPKP